MDKFGDPEFLSHATAARLYTLIVMRAAAADVVPLKFKPYGLALREHVDELRRIKALRVRKSAESGPTPQSILQASARLSRPYVIFRTRPSRLDLATERALGVYE